MKKLKITGIRTFVWWYNIDSLLEGGLTWSLGGYGSPAEKPDVTTSAPPNKATIPATPYKAPKPINPLISAMNQKFLSCFKKKVAAYPI